MTIRSDLQARRPRAPRVLRVVLAWFAMLGALLVALPASAGTLHVTDDAGVLSASDVSAIRKHVTDANFDVRLLTTTSYTSKSDLGNHVHRLVTEPNIVVVGLDPVHRHVSIHFGTGTRIADAEFKPIELAGIPHFKDRDWKGGTIAIVDRAQKSVGTGGAAYGGTKVRPGQAAPSQGRSGIGFFSVFLWIIAIVGVIAIAVWIFSRRSSTSGTTTYVGGSGGYGGPPQGYGGYGPPPGGGYGGGGSGLGSNIVSAGVGGLIGYELGRAASERHHDHYDHEDRDRYGGSTRDDGPEGSSGGDSGQPGNYDAGGTSGGWDDSGSGGGGGGGDDSDF